MSIDSSLLYVYCISLSPPLSLFFFFNDTATTEIYTLSLHDALPISRTMRCGPRRAMLPSSSSVLTARAIHLWDFRKQTSARSEEHTSELQSPDHLVCRLLLEKKKKNNKNREATKIVDLQLRH